MRLAIGKNVAQGNAMQVLILGCGFVGTAFGAQLAARGAQVTGTSRTQEGKASLQQHSIDHVIFDGAASDELRACAQQADVVLQSIPPSPEGDQALEALSPVWAETPKSRWIGYLSTTGVYGDLQGGWAFEDDPPAPLSAEATRRASAEQGWLSLPYAAHVFRLPGIYGPGRSSLEQVLAGTARRIHRQGQVFSRAHRDDIVSALLASLDKPNPGRIYNVCDDLPCPSGDVIAYACQLLDKPVPPLIPFENAQLSEMGKRFYNECKRVSNARLKAELGWRPQFPTYHEGLADCLARMSVS
jgi:nucleoside-diphosphate-sugar epimerase